jgi:hypothetical protein
MRTAKNAKADSRFAATLLVGLNDHRGRPDADIQIAPDGFGCLIAGRYRPERIYQISYGK